MKANLSNHIRSLRTAMNILNEACHGDAALTIADGIIVLNSSLTGQVIGEEEITKVLAEFADDWYHKRTTGGGD